MNTVPVEIPVVKTAHPEKRSWMPAAGFGLLALAIFCLAVSSQSFWIDEAAAVTKAAKPTLQTWWREMNLELGSDKQMPLYMLTLWAWEKIFGHGEWWIRASGIPWLIVGSFLFAGRRWERWIAVLFSAFTWYCLDEARPYALQLGASLALFGAIERLAENPTPTPSRPERIWLYIFLAALIALSGSSLLGMIWAGAAFAAFLCVQAGKGNVGNILRAHKAAWFLAALLLSGLAGFYLWTIHQKIGASSGGTDWRNALFIGFEVLGFSGLGPGRLELRNSGAAALRPYLLPIAIIAASTAAVLGAGFWQARKQLATRRGVTLAVIVCGTALGMLAIGVLKSFRILGRHFTPVAPVTFWLLAGGILVLWQSRIFLKRVVLVVFLIASIASCLSLRFAARHAKDDYRGAAAVAREAVQNGQVVWWCADQRAGAIYGVRMPDALAREANGRVEPDSAIFVWNLSAEKLSALPVPDLVIVSKPDIFDQRSTVAGFAQQHHYAQLPPKQAFKLWKRDATSTP